MGAGSKAKGSKAEREAAALVEAWWRRLEPGAEFARAPMSGAWRGASDKARADLRLVGDLMTNASRFPFTVEIKRREGWSFDTFLAGKRSPVWSWWRQAVADARTAEKTPLLLFRRNRGEWLALLPILVATARRFDLPTPMRWSMPIASLAGADVPHPIGYYARYLFNEDPAIFAE